MDQTQIGILAGVIGSLAYVPYIIAMIKRKTTPNKATWIIWSVLGIIIAASYYSAGARETAFVPFGNAIGIVVVTLLALRYGEDGWTSLDKGCIIGAGAGLILWAATSEPLMALYLTTMVDAIGGIPTIEKAWKRPESEDKLTWVMFVIANSVNILAIREWTLAIAMYPVYVLILSGVMVVLLFYPREDGKISGAGRKPPQRQE
jgi:hypothetical protein